MGIATWYDIQTWRERTTRVVAAHARRTQALVDDTATKEEVQGALRREVKAHTAESKAIRPLSSLAEIKTIKDHQGNGVTQLGHLWYEYKQPGWIKTREYPCLTCENCSQLKFPSCVFGTARV